ncbi:MAG: hypothetical protein AVDCRST_MAG10-916, partial [uncultured Acidimicrobiales bacterium]
GGCRPLRAPHPHPAPGRRRAGHRPAGHHEARAGLREPEPVEQGCLRPDLPPDPGGGQPARRVPRRRPGPGRARAGTGAAHRRGPACRHAGRLPAAPGRRARAGGRPAQAL